MSGSIEQAVMQIKHDVRKALDAAAIVALCQSIGYSWRTRQLDLVATIQGFLSTARVFPNDQPLPEQA